MEQWTGFKLGKEYVKAVYCHLAYLNFYAECIMWNVWISNKRLDETQAGIKITGRNINNLSYADDTTLTAETEEELNSLLIKVKEESENAGLKLNIQKTKIMAASPITSWQIYGETVTDFIFLGSKITADGDCSHEIKRLFPSYLTYMQSTSWEMLDWKKQKLESRLPGEISITSDMQMIPPLWQKVKN